LWLELLWRGRAVGAAYARGAVPTFTSEAKVATATVEAIEASTRTITLKKTDGTYVTTVAGPDVKRFDEIKVGDKVTARYYDNLVLRLKAPGEADVSSASAATTGSGQARPGGNRGEAGDHHGDHYSDRSEGAVDHIYRAEWMEVLVQGR
jgi:hypothetical protein